MVKAAAAVTDLGRRPVTVLKGVGPGLAERLSRLSIATVQDLLFHLPMRYEDRTRVVPIGSLRAGQQAVIEGRIEHAEVGYSRSGRRRRMLLLQVSDATGSLLLRYFHFSAAQQATLSRGTRVRLFGEVRKGPTALEMVHPETQMLSGEQAVLPVEDRLTPVYPATEGLHQLSLRKMTDTALVLLREEPGALRDWLPAELRRAQQLWKLVDALQYVHRPPLDASLDMLAEGLHPAQRRLAFEELLAHNLSLQRLRRAQRAVPAAALKVPGDLQQSLEAALPYRLTAAQARVIDEIARDLGQPRPMQRLLQGDVGSGKTVVAACACLRAIEAGCQAAMMAPTEILAEQHYRSLTEWLEPLGLTVTWLSGRQRAAERREAAAAIAEGHCDLAVGTHALFQDEVRFRDLALVVIDEQHRFGVHQRLALRDKGARDGRVPHQLIMTATPIPRSLAMTAYADLDYSVIDELPPGRKPVTTVALSETRRGDVIARVEAACGRGQQAYWVCTLIDDSDALQAQAAEVTAASLSEALPRRRIGLVHGRLAPAERAATMASFKRGEIDLLVATTVIEVGVDVPNASLMIIENVERLGLSQIHQLRGRVGRGARESSCVLLYRAPLSDSARRRLAVMRATNDGFEIAREDLKLRGPGELLGTRQTGEVQFGIADLVRDADLLPAVQQVARRVESEHPESVDPLVRRWLGDNVRYAQA